MVVVVDTGGGWVKVGKGGIVEKWKKFEHCSLSVERMKLKVLKCCWKK